MKMIWFLSSQTKIFESTYNVVDYYFHNKVISILNLIKTSSVSRVRCNNKMQCRWSSCRRQHFGPSHLDSTEETLPPGADSALSDENPPWLPLGFLLGQQSSCTRCFIHEIYTTLRIPNEERSCCPLLKFPLLFQDGIFPTRAKTAVK